MSYLGVVVQGLRCICMYPMHPCKHNQQNDISTTKSNGTLQAEIRRRITLWLALMLWVHALFALSQFLRMETLGNHKSINHLSSIEGWPHWQHRRLCPLIATVSLLFWNQKGRLQSNESSNIMKCGGKHS
eukprot:scaffold324608_cov33-Prasinocladus_malaysianus.AAC.1